MEHNRAVAVILGVGPMNGLGAALCRRMGQEGLHVIAAGRTVEALDGVVSALGSEGAVASAFVADATKEADVEALFEYAQAVGPLSIAIYNAGNNRPGKIVEMEPEYFEATWRVGCFGGFLFSRQAVKTFGAEGGTLIFTGASASLRGRAQFGAFNSAKGALRNLAQAMAKE